MQAAQVVVADRKEAAVAAERVVVTVLVKRAAAAAANTEVEAAVVVLEKTRSIRAPQVCYSNTSSPLLCEGLGGSRSEISPRWSMGRRW